ncbi:hypothetical protein PX554_13920 [Sphingomonas sp. H39-1-10]|uniref:hypothetical protein n=1 Tax=Sphingomonas pollutisoli TaxID=3030829 RepID=UPI0023B9D826|nr:hypothetical protein [Sphingomonas pollutisoli]MDF0489234.1 hypothetical protein [Sphingomonas pollutisoli]
MSDALKERINLLMIGEAQHKLRPEHQAELDSYRRQGLARGAASDQSATPQGSGGALETNSARDKARSQFSVIDRLQPAVDRVRHLQNTTLSKQGLGALAEYNPFDSGNQAYDAAVANLTALARPATRVAGEGSMSDFESKIATATLPGRYHFDSYNNEALDGLQRLIDSGRKTASQQLGVPIASRQNPQLPKAPPRPGGSSADSLRRRYGLK